MNAESVSFFCVYEEENYVIKHFTDSYFRDVYGMMQGEGASILKFVNIPISIFLGIAIGLLIGVLLAYFFKKMHIRDTSKVLIILSISFLLVVMEDKLSTPITFSALIAIMFIGIGLQKKRETVAKRLSVKYGKLWVAAEVFLFVLDVDGVIQSVVHIPVAMCVGDTLHGLRRSLAEGYGGRYALNGEDL